ncbi:MAG: MFS transporter [Spirochaetaceae bacterium]|nr:MAG: MFS transporter [Spirochaetaceae bacterium]
MILVTVFVPLIDVLTEVGFASAYPQLLAWYGTSLRASSIVAVGPLATVTTGWMWGRIVRRRGLTNAMWLAVFGWSGAVLVMAAGLDLYAVMIAARALQGGFAAGFAAIPFIGVTALEQSHSAGSSRSLRSRRMSRIEVAASIGAISGPITVGSGMVLAPRGTLVTIALIPVVVILVLWRGKGAPTADGTPTADSPRSNAHPQPSKRRRIHRLLLPVLYAAMVGLVLSAFELLVPTIVEERTTRPLVGKLAAMAFEVAVVAGVMIKARRTGVYWWLPVLVAALTALGFVVAPGLSVLMAILLAVGFGIGAQVSMGNELAAQSMRGFETAGMGAYATLRITGSFAGPLFLTISYPFVLLALAVVSLLALYPVVRANRLNGVIGIPAGGVRN